MYYRIIDDEITVYLTTPQFAEDLFGLTERNRDYLKVWLPWLNTILQPEDTRAFITKQLERFSRMEALHQTIFYRSEIAGVVGFNTIDQTNRIGRLGYWLGQEYTGCGIMTRCVQDLVNIGFDQLNLQRIDIRCAVGNTKSRAIPERLGFTNEGVIRRAEKIYDTYNDHVVYGLLR